MFTPLLLLFATASSILLCWLLLRRRKARAKARADFTQFMTVINEWSERFGDYQYTGQALLALSEHDDRVFLAEHTPHPGWIGASSRQHYLAEYKLCLDRHHALLTEDIGDESASRQATELELAIKELGALSDQNDD